MSSALLLAACSAGVGEDSGAGQTPAAGAPASTTTPLAQPTAANGTEPGPVAEPGSAARTAVDTVGDTRYEFAGLLCFGSGGALSAAARGGDPRLTIDLPPMDWEAAGDEWEPPSIWISGSDPYLDLRAGGSIVLIDTRVRPGRSQVDSFTIDGRRASGTATFLDYQAFNMDQDTVPVRGSFELSCPE